MHELSLATTTAPATASGEVARRPKMAGPAGSSQGDLPCPLEGQSPLGIKATRGSAATRGAVELAVMIGLWYSASVVCTNTSKELKIKGWSSDSLTLAELAIATACSYVAMIVLKLRPYKPVGVSLEERTLTCILAAALTLGFATLNSAFGRMHVSLVMVLRATEPLFAAAAAKLFLEQEIVTANILLATVPIIIGAGLSALESSDVTPSGLALVFFCNVCFAARGVATKLLKEKYQPDDFSLFLNVCAVGTIAQLAYAILVHGMMLATRQKDAPASFGVDAAPFDLSATVFVNGITFWMYLQLSWLVLGRVSAVSHSVLNSLRRPVICAFGFLRFGGDPTVMNVLGIALASGGALVYGHVKRSEAKKRISQKAARRLGPTLNVDRADL